MLKAATSADSSGSDCVGSGCPSHRISTWYNGMRTTIPTIIAPYISARWRKNWALLPRLALLESIVVRPLFAPLSVIVDSFDCVVASMVASCLSLTSDRSRSHGPARPRVIRDGDEPLGRP